MGKLLFVFALSVLLAYLAQCNSDYRPIGEKQPWNRYVFLMIVAFSLFSGLRFSYNDTWAYLRGYQNGETLDAFIGDPDNLKWTANPLFYATASLLKTYGVDVQIFFMLFAILDTTLLLRFIQRYAPERYFTFSIFLFFTVGTAVFSIAAMKQITAMAIFTLGVPYLLEKKWLRYYLIVAVAGFTHTYAFMLAILPLFLGKPWRGLTLGLVGVTIAAMLTFENTIHGFLKLADSYGKHLDVGEVLDPHTMNPLRVAVYSIVPVLSLVYRNELEVHMRREQNLFINMSILSLMFMLMATMAGANMFGRMATYFELGTICVLPWVVDKLFTGKTRWLVYRGTVVCFLGFFLYDNQDFAAGYRARSITYFFKLFQS